MKILLAFIVAAISWYPVGWTIYKITRESELALLMTTIISLLLFFFLAVRITGAYNFRSLMSYFLSMGTLDVDGQSSAFYAQAEEECETGDFDKGLWSKALVKAKGNEGQRKIEYMKLRVKVLQRIYNKSRKTDA